jgi:hypothetical protein
MENKVYGFGCAGDGTLVIGELQNNLSIHSMHSGIYAFNCLRNINVLNKGEQLKVKFKVQPCSEKEYRNGTLQIVYGRPRIVDDKDAYYKIENTGCIKIKGYND